MSTCPIIPAPVSSSKSSLAAAMASIGLTLLFFWGLAQSSEHLPPARSLQTTSNVV